MITVIGKKPALEKGTRHFGQQKIGTLKGKKILPLKIGLCTYAIIFDVTKNNSYFFTKLIATQLKELEFFFVKKDMEINTRIPHRLERLFFQKSLKFIKVID